MTETTKPKPRRKSGKKKQPDLMPLDIMLAAMRQSWEDGDTKEAVNIAKTLAPYFHPRAKVEDDKNTDEQLVIELVNFSDCS